MLVARVVMLVQVQVLVLVVLLVLVLVWEAMLVPLLPAQEVAMLLLLLPAQGGWVVMLIHPPPNRHYNGPHSRPCSTLARPVNRRDKPRSTHTLHTLHRPHRPLRSPLPQALQPLAAALAVAVALLVG